MSAEQVRGGLAEALLPIPSWHPFDSLLKQGINERRGGGGTEDDEDADEQQEDDDGDEPEFLVLFEEGQEFGDDAGFFLAGAGKFIGVLFGFAHKVGGRRVWGQDWR